MNFNPEQPQKPTAPFKFGIGHLFYLTALIASGLVVAGSWSFFISGAVLTAWAIIYRCNNWKTIFALVLILGLLVGMLPPSVSHVRESSRRISCKNNMRQILLAIHSYESAFSKLPPAYAVDKDGKPMHSWRILILPFIEHSNLYDQYNFDEPWDGPNNSQLSNQMPWCYRCPSAPDSPSLTNYKLVSGPEAFFDGNNLRSLDDAIDGTAGTIVLVEDCENPVNWLKPEGISIEDATTLIFDHTSHHQHSVETLLSTTYYGNHVGTLDCAIHQIGPNGDRDSFLQALKFADGHSPDVSQIAGRLVIHKPQGYLALMIYLLLLALPGWFLSKRNAPDSIQT